MVLDRAGYEDYTFTQQARKDVEAALAPVRLLDDDRHELRDNVLVIHDVGESSSLNVA
jgi:hypothetical protein